MDLQATVSYKCHLQNHLNWWLNQKNLNQGKSFCQEPSSKIITTDAAKQGYGGHLNNEIFKESGLSKKRHCT